MIEPVGGLANKAAGALAAGVLPPLTRHRPSAWSTRRGIRTVDL